MSVISSSLNPDDWHFRLCQRHKCADYIRPSLRQGSLKTILYVHMNTWPTQESVLLFPVGTVRLLQWIRRHENQKPYAHHSVNTAGFRFMQQKRIMIDSDWYGAISFEGWHNCPVLLLGQIWKDYFSKLPQTVRDLLKKRGLENKTVEPLCEKHVPCVWLSL